MLALKAIGPVLVAIALIVPIITGYRRESLGTSIRLGWGLIIAAYLSIDLFVPLLAQHFHGHAGVSIVAPENPGTMAVAVLGWLQALILHFVGFILHQLVDALRGLLSKLRRH